MALPDGTTKQDRLLTLNDMYYTIFTSKVDFTKPLKGGKVLETGLKGSWVKSDNDLNLSRSIEEGPFEPDANSNRFIYNENVLAAYLTFSSFLQHDVLWGMTFVCINAQRHLQ